MFGELITERLRLEFSLSFLDAFPIVGYMPGGRGQFRVTATVRRDGGKPVDIRRAWEGTIVIVIYLTLTRAPTISRRRREE